MRDNGSSFDLRNDGDDSVIQPRNINRPQIEALDNNTNEVTQLRLEFPKEGNGEAIRARYRVWVGRENNLKNFVLG